MSLLNTGRSILTLFAAHVATFAALYITPPLVTSTVRFDKETEHEDSS